MGLLARMGDRYRRRKERRKAEKPEAEPSRAGAASGSPGEPLPSQLLWLADAPLFIDARQVEAFYDAVLQPDYEEIGKSFGRSVSSETTFGGDLTLGTMFSPLVKGEAGLSAGHKRGKAQESGSTWNRVANPYRHLLALVLRYATETSLHSRLVIADPAACVDAAGATVDLGDAEYLRQGPRAMIMLELGPGTKFVPAALELTDGSVRPIYKELAKRLEGGASRPLPPYRSGADPESVQARHAYWSWFVEFYDRQKALEVVEEAVKDGPIAWIAYRILLHGQFMHLHLAGRGNYDTGVFGYQLLARGERHGLRIVGTLKSEPDINVLAVFER